MGLRRLGEQLDSFGHRMEAAEAIRGADRAAAQRIDSESRRTTPGWRSFGLSLAWLLLAGVAFVLFNSAIGWPSSLLLVAGAVAATLVPDRFVVAALILRILVALVFLGLCLWTLAVPVATTWIFSWLAILVTSILAGLAVRIGTFDRLRRPVSLMLATAGGFAMFSLGTIGTSLALEVKVRVSADEMASDAEAIAGAELDCEFQDRCVDVGPFGFSSATVGPGDGEVWFGNWGVAQASDGGTMLGMVYAPNGRPVPDEEDMCLGHVEGPWFEWYLIRYDDSCPAGLERD